MSDISQAVITHPPGARVEIRGEEWIVRGAEATGYGDVELHVTGVSPMVRDVEAYFLVAGTDARSQGLDEVKLLDPKETKLVRDPSSGYRRSRLFLESLLRRTAPADARLYIGHRGAIDPSDFQLVPAAQALARPKPRILIADAVGLGKTIEVGILLSELIRRGRGRRILVVALKSVLEQFQTELWARFTLPLVRLDSDGLARVRRELPTGANPFHYYDRVIISIDTLKNDSKYAYLLEQTTWDAIVIDECQHVAERGTSASQRARLARLLANTSDALILTSATPHDGRPESFASLLELLDPMAIADRAKYTRADIGDLYIRRFKHDVSKDRGERFLPRSLERHEVAATAEEDALYDALREVAFETIRWKRGGGGGRDALFRTLLLKGLLSSPEALAETLEHRRAKLERELAEQVDLAEEAREAMARDLERIRDLEALTERAARAERSKWVALKKLLADMGVRPKGRERVVIFSERLATLGALEARIKGELGFADEQVALFHGALSDREQQEIVKGFATEKGPRRVLIASDAASEGLNLHHQCHRLVHYDVPWSLITLEQRNGRIDRFGQRHTPEIHYLIATPGVPGHEGEKRVIELLIEKEKAAHESLGDVQWLLQCFDPDAEEARVTDAIEAGEPGIDDLLALLQAPPTREAELLGGSHMGAQAGEVGLVKVVPEIAAPSSLFANDTEYVRAAFDELVDAGALEAPEWHHDGQAVIFHPPDDLRRRFKLLPRELEVQARDHLKLTADRSAAQRSYDEARRKGEFPEWQLLWPLHPALSWLDDRVLSHFDRHEAPVLRLDEGVDSGGAAVLVHGVLSNRASEPVVSAWVVVRFDEKGKRQVQAFGSWEGAKALSSKLVNDGKAPPLEALGALRAPALDMAEVHMRELRSARSKALRPELKEADRRLRTWCQLRLEGLELEEAEAAARGKTLHAHRRRKLEREREEVERLRKKHRLWLEERMTTVDAPYLRLVAVFAGRSLDARAAASLAASVAEKGRR